MLEGRRYPLHLSDEQQRAAASFAAAARLVFNLARGQREAAQRLCQKPPGYAAQCRDLTELRAEVDWLRAVAVHVCQQAIRDYHVAYQRFFSGVSSSPSRDRTGQWWASFCVDTNRRPAPPNGKAPDGGAGPYGRLRSCGAGSGTAAGMPCTRRPADSPASTVSFLSNGWMSRPCRHRPGARSSNPVGDGSKSVV